MAARSRNFVGSRTSNSHLLVEARTKPSVGRRESGASYLYVNHRRPVSLPQMACALFLEQYSVSFTIRQCLFVRACIRAFQTCISLTFRDECAEAAFFEAPRRRGARGASNWLSRRGLSGSRGSGSRRAARLSATPLFSSARPARGGGSTPGAATRQLHANVPRKRKPGTVPVSSLKIR